MPSAHRRFELIDVVLDDVPIGRCTIDQWQDERGEAQWSARVLMPRGHTTGEGRLVGRTREGGFLAGPAVFAGHQDGPRGPGSVLVELHGTGALVPVPDPSLTPPTADAR